MESTLTKNIEKDNTFLLVLFEEWFKPIIQLRIKWIPKFIGGYWEYEVEYID